MPKRLLHSFPKLQLETQDEIRQMAEYLGSVYGPKQ